MPCAAGFVWNAVGEGWRWMVPSSGASAFVVGALVWWALIARRSSPRPARGAACGALVGVLSHPIAWYLVLVVHWLGDARSSLGEPPADPFTAVLGAATFSVWSLLLTGWLTVPVATLVGWLLAFRSKGASRAGDVSAPREDAAPPEV
jgi:hypothetical protein